MLPAIVLCSSFLASHTCTFCSLLSYENSRASEIIPELPGTVLALRGTVLALQGMMKGRYTNMKALSRNFVFR